MGTYSKTIIAAGGKKKNKTAWTITFLTWSPLNVNRTNRKIFRRHNRFVSRIDRFVAYSTSLRFRLSRRFRIMHSVRLAANEIRNLHNIYHCTWENIIIMMSLIIIWMTRKSLWFPPRLIQPYAHNVMYTINRNKKNVIIRKRFCAHEITLKIRNIHLKFNLIGKNWSH